MQDKILKNIATLFGIGYLPFMPGTFASLAGLLFYLVIKDNIFVYIAVTISLTFLGFIASQRARLFFKKEDPSEIVIDELCGILIAYLYVPFNMRNIVIGFLIFRFIDILKIYPICKLEGLKDGWGIMLDDIAAGLFTNIILQVVSYVRL